MSPCSGVFLNELECLILGVLLFEKLLSIKSSSNSLLFIFETDPSLL